MLNRRKFIQLGATAMLVLGAQPSAFAQKAKIKRPCESSRLRIFTVS